MRVYKKDSKKIIEELGSNVVLDETLFELVLDFDEIATSDGKTKIHFYVFEYMGELDGVLETSDEIEKHLWYESSMSDVILSNTLKNEVIPYCIENKKIL